MLLSNDKTDIGIKKTSAQWQSLYPYPKVLDPDGWDRKNYDYSWNEELILFLLKILLFMQNF